MHDILNEIGLTVIAAAVLGALAYRFKQPTIIGYLLAGAIIGPELGFKLVAHPESIEIISEIGLILLLFIIGLEVNIQKLISSGRELLIVGIGQFAICAFLGMLVFSNLAILSGATSDLLPLYLALLCALSSTAVVVKLLYDKFELDTRPGRLTLGILVVQDLWAILILAFQPHFTDPKMLLIVQALLKSALLLGVGFVISKYLLGRVFERMAKSPEMVVLLSIGWCAALAYVAGALSLSKEMGALIAGMSVAAFPYSIHVTAKTLPIRDFFLTLFFASLGMKIVTPSFEMIGSALILLGFVAVSRFVSIYPLLLSAGGGHRTGIIASINLSQISEFSLVIASIGLSLGHIDGKFVATMIYAMAIGSVLSSYAITFNHQIYQWLYRTIPFIRNSKNLDASEEGLDGHGQYPLVILGYHHVGRELVEHIGAVAPDLLSKTLVIDFNLEALKELRQHGVSAMFGDLGSFDTLDHARLSHANVIVSTIPDMLLKGTSNLSLVRNCRAMAAKAVLIATADSTQQARVLEAAGASAVIVPHLLVAEHVVRMLREQVAELKVANR